MDAEYSGLSPRRSPSGGVDPGHTPVWYKMPQNTVVSGSYRIEKICSKKKINTGLFSPHPPGSGRGEAAATGACAYRPSSHVGFDTDSVHVIVVSRRRAVELGGGLVTEQVTLLHVKLGARVGHGVLLHLLTCRAKESGEGSGASWPGHGHGWECQPVVYAGGMFRVENSEGSPWPFDNMNLSKCLLSTGSPEDMHAMEKPYANLGEAR